MKKILLFFIGLVLATITNAAPIEATPVDNIATYKGSDPYVYDQTARKFYAFNNQGVYEEYGLITKVNSLKVAGGGVTEIEYIATTDATGKPYINTGYVHTAETRILMECDIDGSNTANYQAPFGSRSNYGADMFVFFWRFGGQNTGCFARNAEVTGSTEIPTGEKILVNASGLTLDVFKDGETEPCATITGEGDSKGGTTPMYIFDLCHTNHPDNSATFMKLYTFKIFEGELLKMDLVPVVDSEGKGGLKDKITGKVFNSANDANFELSPDGQAIAEEAGTTVYPGKLVVNTKDNHEYKWNGTAWEDLGVVISQPIDMTAYKDLNNWTTNNDHKNVFEGKITYDEAAGTCHLDNYVGTGGWEPLYYKLEGLEAGATYTVSFNFSCEQWKSWNEGSYAFLPFYVRNTDAFDHASAPNNPGGEILAMIRLPKAQTTNQPYSFEFTADKDWDVLNIQFGVCDDGEHNPPYYFYFDQLTIEKAVFPVAYEEIIWTDTEKYTPLAYIESTSAARENVFEFPYKPTTDTKVNVKFQTEVEGGWRAVFSARNVYAGTGMSLYINGNDNAHIGYFTGNTTGNGDNRAPFEIGKEYEAECTVDNLKLNDVDYPTGETACNATSRNFSIFANPEWDNAFHGRIWYFRLSEGEEEICNYVPAMRHDGVFGFYDTVKGDFVLPKKGYDGYTFQLDENMSYVCYLPEARTVSVGAAAKYLPTIQNLDDVNLTWKSADESIATVAEDGTVTGIALGKVQITCTTDADGGWEASYTLEVTQKTSDSYQFAEGSLYGTYVAPFDIAKLHSKVQAFTVEVVDGGFAKLNEVSAIPKGEAVVLKDNGTGHKYTLNRSEEAVPAIADNDLQPANEEITANGGQFILAKLDGKVGFAKAAPGTIIPAGKGYLVFLTAVKAFYPFDEEGETGIENVNANLNLNEGAIYNIAGQRVNKAQKGIYIINGKKVLK